MACFFPIHGYRAPGGQVKFSRKGAWEDRPLTVPCGTCIGCRLERSRQWAVRMTHEQQMHAKTCFLTLTYNDASLPPGESLSIPDWQNFAKKLRRKLGPFRFFGCGEYTPLNYRPHLHIAIYGHDFTADRKFWKTTDQGDTLYTSPTLEKLWPYGFHTIGELSFKSSAYIARYIMKKSLGPQADDHYLRYSITGKTFYHLTPEYVTMSRNPGIGKKWIDKYMTDVYPWDEVIVNGKPSKPPRYYDDQYKIRDPKAFRDLQKRRYAKSLLRESDQTPERLSIRDRVQRASLEFYNQRTLE